MKHRAQFHQFAGDSVGRIAGIALVVMALLLLMIAPAFAKPGSLQRMADGSALVELPMQDEAVLSADLMNQIDQAVMRDSDDELVSHLSGIMKSGEPNMIPAIAVAAANLAPDRGASIAAAAVEADTQQGIRAAQALRHVKGVRKRQILVGVHDTGNRYAYDQVVSEFKARRMPAPGGLMHGLGDGVGQAGFNGKGRGAADGLLNDRRKRNNPLPW